MTTKLTVASLLAAAAAQGMGAFDTVAGASGTCKVLLCSLGLPTGPDGRLTNAVRAELLHLHRNTPGGILARLDLPGGIDPALLDASEICDGVGTFHVLMARVAATLAPRVQEKRQSEAPMTPADWRAMESALRSHADATERKSYGNAQYYRLLAARCAFRSRQG